MSVFCGTAACYGAGELLQTPEQGPPVTTKPPLCLCISAPSLTGMIQRSLCGLLVVKGGGELALRRLDRRLDLPCCMRRREQPGDAAAERAQQSFGRRPVLRRKCRDELDAPATAPELASGHAAAPPLHHGSDEFLIDRAFFQPPVCDRPSGSTRRWHHIPVASRKLAGPRISPSPIRRPAICRCESSRISNRLRGHPRPQPRLVASRRSPSSPTPR
jgi:hypothetical protein